VDGYYTNIDDITIKTWNNASRGNYKVLRIDPKVGKKKKDLKAWNIIYTAYLKEFGISKEYAELLELQVELLEVQIEFIETDNQFLRNEINRLEQAIIDLIKKPNTGDFDTALINLSKWIGHQVDEQTKMKRFKKMVEVHKKEAQAMEKLIKKNK